MTCAARMTKMVVAAEHLRKQSGNAKAPFNLAFMTDAARLRNPCEIALLMPRGSAIILRDYTHPARTALAFRLRNICQQRGLLLFIGADTALAKHCGANGVHFPSWASARALSGFLTSAACHNEEELARAAARNIDVAIVSPAFATQSHPGAPSLGPGRFKALANSARLPVIALGGVTPENADQLAGPNVVGLAAVSAFES